MTISARQVYDILKALYSAVDNARTLATEMDDVLSSAGLANTYKIDAQQAWDTLQNLKRTIEEQEWA